VKQVLLPANNIKNMNCNKCGNSNTRCGCADSAYTTPVTNTCLPECKQRCSEYLNAACVFITDGILDADLPPGTSLEHIIQQLVLMITNPECTNTSSCNCPAGGTLLVQTEGIDNTSQTVLNNLASYGMLITNISGGKVTYEAVVNEAYVVYVDLQHGNDATAQKYNIVRPYLTFAAAYAAAVSGDTVVLNAGNYFIGQVSLSNPDVNIYCKPGVTFTNSGFTIGVSSSLRFYGYAVFNVSNGTSIPLNISSTGETHDIFFQFDKIIGNANQAIYIKDSTSPSLKVLVEGNEITSTSTGNTHLVRVDNSNNINAVININNIISGAQRFIVRLGGFSATTPMIGNIILNCPIIENNGTQTTRACVYLDGVLSTLANDGYKIIVNSSIIRQTNPTMTETGDDIISSCVWIDGGNNVYINGKLEGNSCLAVCNRGLGATPHYGTIIFQGDMSSDIECISSCVKQGNGNGWHSIVVKDSAIVSEGKSGKFTVIDRPVVWNVSHGGINGKLQFINTRIYNKNVLTSAGASCIISSGNANKRTFLYDTLMVVDNTSAGCIETSIIGENVGMVNTRSNVVLGANVNDIYVGFLDIATLEIPEY
jgi:hypothetical protein